MGVSPVRGAVVPALRTLYGLVFAGGVATLGMEMSAARLLEPALGNSQLVWAALIGLILLYLALGAWLGGKLADRYPQQAALETVMMVAALALALIPTVSPPVLRWAALGLGDFAVGLLAAALLAVVLLFSIPGILLGAVTPWAVRLALQDVEHAGQIGGRFYAIGTAGSILGAFLPALVLIPTFGTRWTFYLLALFLLAVITLSRLPRRTMLTPLVLLIGILLLVWLTRPSQSIRAGWDDGRTGKILFEDESLYNYIVVREWGEEHHLKLNDGVGIHSVYHPQILLSQGIWDYFLLAPFFNPPPTQPADTHNLLLIGLAAGTVSELFTNIYGPIPITGVELDPEIITVGRRYFNMNQPNLNAIAADGRRWLLRQPASAQWDMIAIDAYRPPYIPFHLTTVEFFTLVREHLSADGVVAINVGHTAQNFMLVDALGQTLAQVFPTVYALDEPGPADGLSNSLVVATRKNTSVDNFGRNVADLPSTLPAEFRTFAQGAIVQVRRMEPPADTPIFTDDRAPVEQVVHRIIWDFLSGGGAGK